jgi:hypothetical protein
VDFEPGIEGAMGFPRRLADSRAAAALLAALQAADMARDTRRRA